MENIIEIENLKKGDIIKGYLNHKYNGHYIIFIQDYYFPDFIGAMITSKNCDNKNILMSENHFNKKFDDGTDCRVIFKNSHLVIARLHKFYDMGPFGLFGSLTESGIEFVAKNIGNLEIESWDQYLERTNTN